MLTAGVRYQPRVGRVRNRPVPNEYAEAVEKWARERHGHAKLKWLPDPMNCWAVILEYRVNDPHKLTDSDGEPVLLHDWKGPEWWAKHRPKEARRSRGGHIMGGNYAYDLDELGVSGIIERLDRGNILSGRGMFRKPMDGYDHMMRNHEKVTDKRRSDARDDAGAKARDKRRSLFKIPFLGVGIEFNSKGEKVKNG